MRLYWIHTNDMDWLIWTLLKKEQRIILKKQIKCTPLIDVNQSSSDLKEGGRGGGVLLVSDSATTINHSIYATHFLNGVLKSIPTIEVLQKSTEKTKQYGIYKNIAFSHASSVLLLYMLTENLLLYLPKQVFCMFQYNEGKRRWHHINDT